MEMASDAYAVVYPRRRSFQALLIVGSWLLHASPAAVRPRRSSFSQEGNWRYGRQSLTWWILSMMEEVGILLGGGEVLGRALSHQRLLGFRLERACS